MSTERRHTPRARVLRRGRIVFKNGHSVVDCIVLDLSDGGARLKVGDWLGVPRRFELRLDHGPSFRAEVRYRDLEVTGVEFVEAA